MEHPDSWHIAGLAHKTVVVTGGAGGLGRACAETLLKGGAEVILADLGGERLEHAVAGLANLGEVSGLAVDLSEIATAQSLGERAVQASAGKRIDGLVNAVGIMRTVPMAELPFEQWQQTMRVNLDGVFLAIQSVAKLMVAEGSGSIVTIASVAARSGRPNAADYAASKAALLSLTKSAALAYAPTVRVNAICPGVFLTPMWSGIMADRDKEFGAGAGQGYLDEVASKTPLGRVGDPSELAAAAAFLISDLASFITGQGLNVDGGLEMN
jgi:NAD(P)-dependent dehydrogenase (short-subunit alcohol dehydrogenase family)